MGYINIVNEEIQKFLNEGFVMQHENFSFRQNVKNSTFNNYEGFSQDFDSNIMESDVFVNWHIAFWLNDSGVENLIVTIDNVDGVYRLQQLNKQTDQLEQETDKNIADITWKFDVENASVEMGGTLYITTLNFDFATNTCKVTF